MEFLGQIDGQMSNGAEGVSRVAGVDAAMVFAKMGIQNVEAAFDQPAASQAGTAAGSRRRVLGADL